MSHPNPQGGMYTILRPGHGGGVPGGDPNGQQFMVNAAHMNGGQFFMPSPPLFYAPPGAPPAMAGVPVPPPHPGGTPAPGWETSYPAPYGHPQPRVLAVVPGYQHMQQMGGLPPGIQVTHMGPMGGIPPGVQMLLPPDQMSHQGYRIVNQFPYGPHSTGIMLNSSLPQFMEDEAARAKRNKTKRPKEYLDVRKMLKIIPTKSVNFKAVSSEHDEEIEAFLKTLPDFDRKRRVYNHEPFPERLYRMLVDSEPNKFENIICFTDSGKGFYVHDSDDFEREVGPVYFRHCKFSSFRRQLSMYGFQRHGKGPEIGAFYHKLFCRGRPDLLRRILRVSEMEKPIQMQLYGKILFPPETTRSKSIKKVAA